VIGYGDMGVRAEDGAGAERGRAAATGDCGNNLLTIITGCFTSRTFSCNIIPL